jgi:hypothetical protein
VDEDQSLCQPEDYPSTLTINHLAIYKQLSSIDVNVLGHLGIDFVA